VEIEVVTPKLLYIGQRFPYRPLPPATAPFAFTDVSVLAAMPCASAMAGPALATGTFIRRRTKKASTAAVRSKTMAMPKTPAQPIFGSVNLAPKGVQTLGTTVRTMP